MQNNQYSKYAALQFFSLTGWMFALNCVFRDSSKHSPLLSSFYTLALLSDEIRLKFANILFVSEMEYACIDFG